MRLDKIAYLKIKDREDDIEFIPDCVMFEWICFI